MGRELKVRGSMDVERLAGYLHELAASLSAGTVVVKKGQSHVVLLPASPVWVEVEAEKGKTKETLSVEVSWVPSGRAQEMYDLVISSDVPEPEIEPELEEEAEPEDEPDAGAEAVAGESTEHPDEAPVGGDELVETAEALGNEVIEAAAMEAEEGDASQSSPRPRHRTH
jgi:amphi-Trp domain-containing protein